MDSARTSSVLHGTGASPGIAIGTAQVVDRSHLRVIEFPVSPEQIPDEIDRLALALDNARSELRRIRDELSADRGQEHLYVIDAHLLILEDNMIVREVTGFIRDEEINAEAAIRRTTRKFLEHFAGIEDDYLRERGRDIETVMERILHHMAGNHHRPLPVSTGKTILVAHDLSPADILQIDTSFVAGFVTDLGGRNSHTAILARALEIPAVVGMETATSDICDGDLIVIDGILGVAEINPDSETLQACEQRQRLYEYQEQELNKLRDLTAETPDGHVVMLQGNVEFPEEIPAIAAHGGQGIGLYRTELLFMNRNTLPDEEEQYAAYASVVRAAAPHPVCIRTLDVGGDKLIADLNLADEANPALGVRAVRLSLREPDIFRTQLRAILRAAALGTARVFFPMISGLHEFRAAKSCLEEAKRELAVRGVPYDDALETGIMIEIPSAVITADLLAREVDFFSVGTNDLIQYTLAIDRSNEHLAHLYEPLHPAILRSLKTVVDAAHAAGIRACICGEMAGDPEYLPILLGLGFDELSMSPAAIPRVKRVLRRCPRSEAEQVVAKALSYDTAAEVECYLRSEIAARFSESFD
jgi:phosphotransferase system enzyme I (PtsI)